MQRSYSEFGLIQNIASRFESLNPTGIEGIGDDCAILSMEEIGADLDADSNLNLNINSSINSNLDSNLNSSKNFCENFNEKKQFVRCITTDMLVENVHFTRSISPFDLGVRSVEVNLSDIAAMGARSIAILCSIALPEWVDEHWTEEFFRGIHSCNVPLIGGDTTRSRSGLCINITAIGQAPRSNIKRRKAAKIGDQILVAGQLGASARSNYTTPVFAQRAEGVWFGCRKEVGAMMDLSDGLAGDLPHILRASGVGAVVELDKIPLAQGATIEQALGGGEDYKLLLTADGEAAKNLQQDFAKKFGATLYNIGEIVESDALLYTKNGAPTPLNLTGFRHF